MRMVDELIERAWQIGRSAWPDVELELEQFASHARTLDREGIERFASDVYLATACLAGDAIAIDHFDRELISGARGAILGIDGRPAFADEALQRLRTSLLVGEGGLPRLATYAARGPLRAWVGVSATRTALMMRRSQRRAKEVPADDDDWAVAVVMISTNNPELELLKRQYADAFGHAFRDAVAALEARQRAALRLSFVDALSIDEISTIYGVHRATAARWITRACDTLFETTRSLLADRLALTPTDLDRMTALVRSQLDVSLSQLLPRSLD
jgi:RNA polymerase sigma-70 factor, ECF subfamily